MNISVAHPIPIHIPRVSMVGLKVAFAALTLYVLCVAAPALYVANPAIRAYEEQEIAANNLHGQLRARVRQQHLAVLAEADKLDNIDARTAFLRAALERANDDLAACESLPAILPTDFGCRDILFHRITGNRLLGLYKQEAHRRDSYVELARLRVKGLTSPIADVHFAMIRSSRNPTR